VSSNIGSSAVTQSNDNSSELDARFHSIVSRYSQRAYFFAFSLMFLSMALFFR
jgi:hypothetical protein